MLSSSRVISLSAKEMKKELKRLSLMDHLSRKSVRFGSMRMKQLSQQILQRFNFCSGNSNSVVLRLASGQSVEQSMDLLVG